MRFKGGPKASRKWGTPTFSEITTLAFIVTSATAVGVVCALAGTGHLKQLLPDIPHAMDSGDAMPPLFGP